MNEELTPCERLYNEIKKLQEQLRNEKDPTKWWGLRRRIRKLQDIYNVCTTEEMHRENIQNELRTRGY